MRSTIEIDMSDVLPDRGAVLAHQGIPANAAVSERISALYIDAVDAFTECARPVGIVREIDRTAFQVVFAGEGRNADDSVPGFVSADARHLALFAVTVGAAVSDKIDDLFARNDFAIASMVDSVASRAADRASAAMAALHYARLIDLDVATDDDVVLGYSPGYCGWDISGQRKLFEYLKPGEIGISLKESCMMSPLKSVSGLLITAEPDAHRFKPRFSYCPECKDHSCVERIRQLPNPGRRAS